MRATLVELWCGGDGDGDGGGNGGAGGDGDGDGDCQNSSSRPRLSVAGSLKGRRGERGGEGGGGHGGGASFGPKLVERRLLFHESTRPPLSQHSPSVPPRHCLSHGPRHFLSPPVGRLRSPRCLPAVSSLSPVVSAMYGPGADSCRGGGLMVRRCPPGGAALSTSRSAVLDIGLAGRRLTWHGGGGGGGGGGLPVAAALSDRELAAAVAAAVRSPSSLSSLPLSPLPLSRHASEQYGGGTCCRRRPVHPGEWSLSGVE